MNKSTIQYLLVLTFYTNIFEQIKSNYAKWGAQQNSHFSSHTLGPEVLACKDSPEWCSVKKMMLELH